MTLRGRGRKSVRRITGLNAYRATFLSIMVIGLGLCSRLDIAAHESAEGRGLSRVELEMMRMQLSPMDAWLYELGFAYDETLGRVRNPFDFPRGEADPSLDECFVELDNNPNSSLMVGAAGSGKTAQLLHLAKGFKPNSILFYNSAVILHAVLDDIFHIPAVRARLAANDLVNIILDVDDAEHVDSQIIALILERVNSLDAQGIHLCIALPERFRSVVAQYEYWEIRWSSEKLREFLRQRLLWAFNTYDIKSQQSLISICMSDVENPDQMLCSLARNPRHLLELGQYLFHAHTQTLSAKEGRLGINDWDSLRVYAQFAQHGKSGLQLYTVAPTSPISISPPPWGNVSKKILQLLDRLDDSEMDRFLLCYYPSIYEKIGRGIGLYEKKNRVLYYCYRNQEKIEKLMDNLREITEN